MTTTWLHLWVWKIFFAYRLHANYLCHPTWNDKRRFYRHIHTSLLTSQMMRSYRTELAGFDSLTDVTNVNTFLINVLHIKIQHQAKCEIRDFTEKCWLTNCPSYVVSGNAMILYTSFLWRLLKVVLSCDPIQSVGRYSCQLEYYGYYTTYQTLSMHDKLITVIVKTNLHLYN